MIRPEQIKEISNLSFILQDSAYFEEPDTRRLLVTCWVPLMDTDAHNGGMGVMEGSHRLARLGSHFGCEGDTWYVGLDRELQCSEQDERQCKVGCSFTISETTT